MDFDRNKVAEYYDYIEQQINFPDAYITELFVIGKLTQDPNLKDNIATLLKNLASKDINKAFKSNTKIPNTGTVADNDKTLEALISFGNKAQDLDIDKIFQLLGYDTLFITRAAISKKTNANLWLFSRLSSVKRFIIWNETFPNKIIPDEIGGLIGLEELEISGVFRNIPKSVANCKNLKKLSLKLSHIANIPDELQCLNQLETLKIAGEGSCLAKEYNEILTLPHWIGNLQHLKKLELGYLTLNELSADVFPPNLEKLRIYRMHNIKTLPDKISSLKLLRSFDLHVCNELEELPKEMYKLDKLEHFEIGTIPKITSIDGNIVFSPNIKTFRLPQGMTVTEPDKKISSVKDLSIQNQSYLEYLVQYPELFPDLETLYISQIKQYALKKGLNNLPNLKSITVWNIADIPALFQDVNTCKNLDTIILNNSELTTFPNISPLNGLKYFKIHHCNKLNINTDQLPAQIDKIDIAGANKFIFGHLPIRLNSLNMYATHIENFDAIGTVLDAQNINLYFSDPYTIDGKIQIESLPASISQMKNLISFHFHGKISNIDASLNNLQQLEILELSGLDSTAYSGGLTYPIQHIAPLTLPNLTTLKIANYTGTNLEEIFNALPNLKSLALEKINHYDVLPTAANQFLTYIKLYDTGFSDFSQVQANIKSFEAYFCPQINKQSIQTISTWAQLDELQLKYISDSVDILPESLKNLNLSVLNLNHIRLKQIPDFIGEMNALKVLYLDGFYVDGMPKSIAFLPNLQYLSIDSTTFRYKLADDFRQLKIKQLRMFMSKFAGNNMKQELYEPLLTPKLTQIVREFTFD